MKTQLEKEIKTWQKTLVKNCRKEIKACGKKLKKIDAGEQVNEHEDDLYRSIEANEAQLEILCELENIFKQNKQKPKSEKNEHKK